MNDAYEEYGRGYELHKRGGHAVEAEAAYRRAIAGGQGAAWCHLGTLLWPQPGRLEEAAAAF